MPAWSHTILMYIAIKEDFPPRRRITLHRRVSAYTCFGPTARESQPGGTDNLNRIESSQGLPAGWYPNKRQEFSPLPKVEFPVEQDGKAMHISNIQGREGCRFESYRVIPAEKGGKLVLTINVKGRGTGVFTVQAYSGKKWTGHIF